MRNFIRLFIALLIALNLNAQSGTKEKVDSVNSLPYEFIVSNLRQSIKIFNENLTLAEELNYPQGIAVSNTNLGLAYYLSGSYDKSTYAYLHAIKIFEDLNETAKLSETLGEFGYQLKRRDMKRANQYMMRGIRLAEKDDKTKELSKIYNNYGVLKEMEGRLDSAMYYYEKAYEIVVEIDDSIGIPYSLNRIAGVLAIQGKYKEALDYMARSDIYRNKEKGDFGRIENLVLYGDIHNQMGDAEKAIDYYKRSLNLSIENNVNYLTRYCYQKLTELYRARGDYKKALDSYMAYTSYKDSVLNEDINLKIADLELDYETEKKDKEIAESRLALEQRNSLLIISGIVVVLLILGSIGIYQFQQIKKQKLLYEVELKNQIKQAEYEQKISEEKLRISRELHDNIGSQLTFLISSIDNLTYTINDNNSLNKLKKLSTFGRTTLDELRNTIWAMKNEDGSLEALVLKLNDVKSHFRESLDNVELIIRNNVTKPVLLSSVQILNLFRITQEAIQNSLKYSGCSKIEILFEESASGITMHINDNGGGFDIETARKGNGRENMKHRCEKAGGQFSIDSNQSGTSIECSINLH